MFLIAPFVFLFSGNAFAAFNLITGQVVDSYGSCSWRDNGDGTSTLNLVMNFKKAFTGQGNFVYFSTRGVMIYTYNKYGQMNPSGNSAKKVWINSVQNTGYYTGTDYVIYHGTSINGLSPQWKTREPFAAEVSVLIENSKIADWPAVSIRAGNYTDADDVAEVTGGAYFDRNNTGSSCNIIDPEKPPPPAIAIGMTAPDWNLGELPEGNGEKIFPNSSDQLCFTYSGTAVSGKQFIINAGSANGVVSNLYRLKNLKDASQLIPYSVTLDSGTSNVVLPNANKKALSFNSSGKTCFVPTFKTTVDPNIKSGDYSDVLAFTVVTKS